MTDDVGANHHSPALAETLLDVITTAEQSKNVAPSDAERSEATGGNEQPSLSHACNGIALLKCGYIIANGYRSESENMLSTFKRRGKIVQNDDDTFTIL